MEMPPLDSGSETIILRGEPDKLGPALTQVYAKVRGEGEEDMEKKQSRCWPLAITQICVLCEGEECDGGGSYCSCLVASFHHRQERTEHRTDHTAASTGKGEEGTGVEKSTWHKSFFLSHQCQRA